MKKCFWWVPYDPNSFISDRKVRNWLSIYIHHRIPKVEKYANQDVWVEGTLIEEFTQQEKMEQAMNDLEKTLDLDSFGYVSFNFLSKLEWVHLLLELHSNLYKKPAHQFQVLLRARKWQAQNIKQ